MLRGHRNAHSLNESEPGAVRADPPPVDVKPVGVYPDRPSDSPPHVAEPESGCQKHAPSHGEGETVEVPSALYVEDQPDAQRPMSAPRANTPPEPAAPSPIPDPDGSTVVSRCGVISAKK